jgi:hypothetical protein
VVEGKRVAVVGGGSSAVQIIPSIQPQVEKLYAYLRSPVWITAGFGAKHAAPGGVNFDCKAPISGLYPCLFPVYTAEHSPLDTEEQKAQFARDPSVLDTYCRDVEGELNKRFTLVSSNFPGPATYL